MAEESSLLLSNYNRSLASATSEKNQADEVFKQLGIMDQNGVDVSEGADQEREQRKQARTEQLQKILDAHAEAQKPKDGKPTSDTPPVDQNIDQNIDPTGIGVPNKDSMSGQGLQKAGSAVVGAVKKVGSMIKEQASNNIKPNDMLGPQIMGGIASGIENTVNGGIAVANWFDNKFGKDWIPDDFQVHFADHFVPQSELDSARLVRGVSQFLVPYSGVKKILGTGKVAGTVAGMAADFLAFPGKQERLSNLIQNIPELANPVTGYLQAKPGDTEAEGRVKSVLEGLGLGAATEGVLHVLGFTKHARDLERNLGELEKMQMGKADAQAISDQFSSTKSPEAVPVDANAAQNKLDMPPMDNPQSVLEQKPLPTDKGGGALPNLQKINEPPDVLSIIQNVAEKDRALLEPELAKDATFKDIQGKPLVPVKELFNKPQDYVFTAPELYSARVYRAAAARSVKAISLLEGGTSDFAFMQALEGLRQMSFITDFQKSRYGVGLNSLKIPVSGEQALPYMQDLLSMHGTEEVSKMKAMIKQLPEDKISEIASSSYKKRLFDAVFEGYINNLFTLKSHVVNFASNFSTAQSSWMERYIAEYMPGYKATNAEEVRGLWERQKALQSVDRSKLSSMGDLVNHDAQIAANQTKLRNAMLSGVESGEWKNMIEAEAQESINQVLSSYTAILETTAGITRAVREGGGKSLVDIVKGGPNLDPFTKVEGTPHAISSENLGGGAFVDIVGGVARLNTRGLEWADNVWKAINYRMEVNALANRMAIKQGLEGAGREAFIKEFTTQPPDFVSAPGQWDIKNGVYEMTQKPGLAVEAARKRTFTNPLDTEWGQNIDRLAKTKILGAQPLRFILPFTRTPLNISKYALDRTPLAMLGEEYKSAIAQGGAPAQMARAQVAFGSTLLGTVSLLAGAGMINGAGPREPNARKIWKDQGNNPYSLKVGNQQIPLDKLEPFGSIVSIAVDLSEISAAAGRSFIGLGDDDMSQLGGLMAYSLVKHLNPEMVMDNMGKMFDAIQSGDASKIVGDIAPKLVPVLGGELGTFRKMTDTKQRSVMVGKDDPFPWLQSVVRNFYNKVPGLSQTLPPLKNIWGDDVEYPHGVAEDVVSPFWGTKIDNSPVMKELLRLGYTGQLAKKKAPEGESYLEVSLPDKKLSVKGIPHGSVDLDSTQWTRYIELSAGKGLKYKNGVDLKEALNKLVSQNYYKKFSDPDQRKFIKQTINEYRQAAAVQMVQEDRGLEKKMYDAQNAYLKARGLRNEPK